MRIHTRALAVVLTAALLSAGAAEAGRRVYTLTGLQHPPKPTAAKPTSPTDTEKPFADLIKDRVVIPGLFTFYRDTVTGSVYMAITPEQLDRTFLMNNTISRGDGVFSSNGAMDESFPFYLKRIGKKVLVMEKNVRFRADTSSAFSRAIPYGLSDHLYASCKIESKPQDSTKAILIDAAGVFVRDAENLGYFAGQQAQTGLSFDKENSFFETIKSFPENSEIDVKLHYRSNKPLPGLTLQNPYSLFHTYHFSLSTLPTTDCVPRLGDDRIATFMTIYEDYSDFGSETPYVRYINRWNLKKRDTTAALSEPVEPIVYWVENTVPQEFKAIVAEGIEFWNRSFEKIGFKNAIVAKQMPDTATWDPADVRYNTVRWILEPGQIYASGPSRANPYTGQIYDADVRVSADFIRLMFGQYNNFVAPVSFDGRVDDRTEIPKSVDARRKWNLDDESYEVAEQAAFGLECVMASSSDPVVQEALRKRYTYEYLRWMVAHEVGHTLGFRHNFKSSAVYSLEQLADSAFTRVHSVSGSIMDYPAPNIAGRGKAQGHFCAPITGPADDWTVEYAYSDWGAASPEKERARLEKIASRAAEPQLVYASDDDALLGNIKSVDPDCNVWDLSNDVIAFSTHKIELTRDLWSRAVGELEQPGVRYPRIRTAFQSGWRSYTDAATWVPKFIGGIHGSRDHIGDPNARLPYENVSAADQHRAMKFLQDYLFAPNAFDLPAELLNKLALDHLPDFEGSVYSASQLDYPIHQQVLRIQTTAIDRLYSPFVVGRLLNNSVRYGAGEIPYLMVDMFTDMRMGIWAEALAPKSVNSFRRQLQLAHLEKLINVYLSSQATYPSDARTLAANDLNLLERACARAGALPGLDAMSQAHFKEVIRQIQGAQKAQREYGSTFSVEQ